LFILFVSGVGLGVGGGEWGGGAKK
jgi:hypothetical protein